MVRFRETTSLESQEMERLKENSLEVINGLKIVTALPSFLSRMLIRCLRPSITTHPGEPVPVNPAALSSR